MAHRIKEQAVFLSEKGTFADFNEATLTYAGQLGAIARVGNKVYQLVKHADATGNGAATELVYWKDKAKYEITRTVTNLRNRPAGVLLGAVTAGNHGFVQIGGIVSTKSETTGTPAADDVAVANSANNSVLKVAVGTAPTHVVVGIYAGVVAAGVANVELMLAADE